MMNTDPAASTTLVSPPATEGVSACRVDDVPAVARLHCSVFGRDDAAPTPGLIQYYRDVFFENPWCDPELPSLVYRAPTGHVVGFMGRVPRPMRLRGKRIRVAIGHRLMVAPGATPLAAASLVRRFLAGPQDLSFSDGANDLGRRFWEGSGGSTALAYSLNWVRLLRPSRWFAEEFGHWCSASPIAPLMWALSRVGDHLVVQARRSPLRLDDADTLEEPLEAHALVATHAHLLTDRILPDYDVDSAAWLLERLRENRARGTFTGIVVRSAAKRLLGACAYYLNKGHKGEVVLLAASNDTVDRVLTHLFRRARAQGTVYLQGRLSPQYLQPLLDQHCFLKRGSWALVHARDPRLMNAVHSGCAFLSGLDGELWLRSPRDRL